MATNKRDDRRRVRAFLRPGYERPFWGAVLLLGAVFVARIALTPWLDGQVRAFLAQQPQLRATYSDLSLFSWPPSAVFSEVTVDGIDGRPMLSMRRLEVHTTWSEIWRAFRERDREGAPPSVRLRLLRPTLMVRSADPKQPTIALAAWLRAAPATQVEIASIEEGRVLVGGVGGASERECASAVSATFDGVALPPRDVGRLVAYVDTEACRRLAKALPTQATAFNESHGFGPRTAGR